MLLILAALTSASLLLVRRRVEQQLRGQILQDVRNSVATFQNVQRLRVLTLRHSAELLANLPISRALMTTGHAATIQDVSRELWTTGGTDLLVLSDRTGEIMGMHSTAPVVDRRVAQQSLRQSLAREQTEYWWMAGNHVYEVAIEPIYFGPPAENRVLGFLAVGYEMDDRVARELSQVAASQVAFWYGSALVRSTLRPDQEKELQKQPGVARHPLGIEPIEMRLGPESYWVSSVDLAPGSTPAVRLMVLKSLAEANALIHQLDQLMLGLGLIAVLAGTAMVFVISRTFTRPLDNLVAGVRALERGEYNYPLPVHGHGEAAELTSAFARMRTSLQQSQRELLEGERLATIGRMASSISHDLRHQLAAILANAEFLSERRSEAERVELYQELRAAVFQMTDLIDSLLEFSRPRESLRLGWVRMNEVLERAMQTVRARPEFREIEINVRGDAIDGWFDGNKLQRAFQNLIINACEATERNHGKVTFDMRRRGRTVEIAVQDNGRGIPDHLRDHIFEPFVSYGKENGTGLGLTVVHKIVVDHSGEVKVQETSPGGTTLLVSLPLLLSPPQPMQAPAANAALVRTDGSE
ncbi:MAG: HAMP domain-containing histidine kinase [Acidobacteriia bacterium]|nr:HAMP domain-containing histidine kinase [Terriglobia bacterium]